MTDRTIFGEITQWLSTHFGTDRRIDWYVGITSDIDDRLFGYHGVDRNGAGWIWRKAHNADHARSAEAMLLNHGHDGGRSGGDHSTVYVYAYRQVPGTVR